MKIIIILLFFPYFSSSYWFDCSPCNCLINENDLKTGNCNKNSNVPNLKEIPENIDKEIKILKFKEQYLTILRQNHFWQFQNLHEIYLNKNKISFVHENALTGLSNLSKLDLGYNELTTLPINFFSKIPNLIYLWINNNKLTSLEENLFFNLPLLNEVHLQENNIIIVSKNTFLEVPSLSVIDLSYNNLQNLHLNIIDNIKTIKYFILHENPWICNKSLCEFRETAIKNKWLTTIPDCNGKSWKDLNNYAVNIITNQTIVKEEENVIFTCEYQSCIDNELIWKSNHKELKQIENIRKDEKDVSVLTLTNVDKSDEGPYTCFVHNCDDCDPSQVYLNVTEKPKSSRKITKLIENTQPTKQIERTTTNLPETIEESPSSSWSLFLAISVPLTLLSIVLACCCCYCFCPDCWCYKKIFKNLCWKPITRICKRGPKNNNKKREEQILNKPENETQPQI